MKFMPDRKFFLYASIIVYITTLIYPFENQWFFGSNLFLLSSVFSIMMVFSGEVFTKTGLGVVFLFMPFFNVIYLVSLFSYKSALKGAIRKLAVYTVTLLAIIFQIEIGFLIWNKTQINSIFLSYSIWVLSLVFLSTFFLLSSKKNVDM